MLVTSGSAAPELRWDAPPGCPDVASVRARVAEIAGDGAAGTPVRVDAEVSRVADGWHLRLAIDRGGEVEVRELDDAACDGLAESAAVLVAIAIAPDIAVPPPDDPTPASDAADATEPTATPAPTPAAEPERAAKPATISADRDTPRRRIPPLHVSMRIIGGASFGWLPPGGDVGALVSVWWRWLRLEAGGSYSPRRRVRFDDLPSSGVDASGWATTVRGCGVLHPLRWLDIPLCAGVEVGQVIGRPVALVDGRTGRPVWAAGVLAPALAFVVHPRVALWVAPELLVGMTRPTLRITNEDAPIFAAPGAGGRVHAGIELRFR